MRKPLLSFIILFIIALLIINILIIDVAYTTIMSLVSQIALPSGQLKIIANLFSAIAATLVIFTAIVIILERRDPAKTLAWLLVLIFLPIIGFLLYLAFGRQFKKRRITAKKRVLNECFYPLHSSFTRGEAASPWMAESNRRLINLVSNNSKFPVTTDNAVELLSDGEEIFSAFCAALNDAKEHIHLETYILRNDYIGGKISAILKAKAEEGVKVRVIYDALGSRALGSDYLAEMRASGVQIEAFFSVRLPFFHNKINYRNHRKILVVDGIIGFVGGINIGDEYLGRDPTIGFWRDDHLKIEGSAVYFLQRIFLLDWYFITKESLGDNFPCLFPLDSKPGDKAVQITASGPDTPWEAIMQVYYYAMATAQNSIHLVSPYFVPNEAILTALQTAALSGVDVKIMLPAKADHQIVELAARSYFEELMESGVEIYLYKKGFLHSKILTVDGSVSSVGSANMDQRSFNLNFEVNALLYDEELTRQLEEDFKTDMLDSEKLSLEVFKGRPLYQRVLESATRLFSPLL